MERKPGNSLGQRLRNLAIAGVCGLALPGCLSVFHPVHQPNEVTQSFFQQLPADCRSKVYIFLINGNDPFEYGNLPGLRDHLNCLGFTKTYYGQLYHGGWMAKEMHTAYQECPEARFVVIGYGYGCSAARKLAREAADQGIPIDLVVFLDAWGMPETPAEPLKAHRIVHVQSGDSWWNHPTHLQDAENVQIPNAGQFEVPTHQVCLDLITSELVTLTQQVPVYRPDTGPLPPLVDPAPAPRPLTTFKPAVPDEWDFLKPVSRQKVRELTPPIPPTTKVPFASQR